MWEFAESLYNLKSKHTNNLKSLLLCYYQCSQNSNGKLSAEPIAASDKGEQKLDRRMSLLSLQQFLPSQGSTKNSEYWFTSARRLAETTTYLNKEESQNTNLHLWKYNYNIIILKIKDFHISYKYLPELILNTN